MNDPHVMTSAPWHEGERILQEMAGARDRMEERGRVVLRDHMPDQHRQFFCERNQLFIAALDPSGQPWATVVEGDVGFITSRNPRQLDVATVLRANDPAAAGVHENAPVGVLGLEFDTRRRNRMNGTLRLWPDRSGFSIDVLQSFGNCPKYIQARKVVHTGTPSDPVEAQHSPELSPHAIPLIEAADTFFIASRSVAPGTSRSEGLDVSHRGGRPGFVQVRSARSLAFPDYLGNMFFNSLGNIQLDPRCGLLFIDFARGTTLQLAGRAKLVTDPDFFGQWPGAERAVVFEVDQVVITAGRSRYRWDFLGYAPQFG